MLPKAMHEFLNGLLFSLRLIPNVTSIVSFSSQLLQNFSSRKPVFSCLYFTFFPFTLLVQFCFICFCKRRHFLIFIFLREVAVAMQLLNMLKRVERDCGLAPDSSSLPALLLNVSIFGATVSPLINWHRLELKRQTTW